MLLLSNSGELGRRFQSAQSAGHAIVLANPREASQRTPMAGISAIQSAAIACARAGGIGFAGWRGVPKIWGTPLHRGNAGIAGAIDRV